MSQEKCLVSLALSLHGDEQLDAAEEATSRVIDLVPGEGQQFWICESHLALGRISQTKGNNEEAVHHFEAALGIASHFGWDDRIFWIHYSLAELFFREGRLDDAKTHFEHAKSHGNDSALNLGLAMELQTVFWYQERRLEEARSGALRSVDVYEKLGVLGGMEAYKMLAQQI